MLTAARGGVDERERRHARAPGGRLDDVAAGAPFAVKTGATATPDAFVRTPTVRAPRAREAFRSGPVAGAENVTSTPDTGLPSASVTVTASRTGKRAARHGRLARRRPRRDRARRTGQVAQREARRARAGRAGSPWR